MAVSDQLGETKDARLSHGTVRYRERGSGPPIVFVHGALVNADLWRKVVPELAASARCIAPDWPLGSHELPMGAEADLSPPGLAALIAELMEALDLRDVTLVGNDTGGGLCQIVAANHPERLGRLVLTPCDAFRNFPPVLFKPLQLAGYLPGATFGVAQSLRPRVAQRLVFGLLAKRVPEREILDSYAGPSIRSAAIRQDFARFFRQLRSRHTLAAAERLREFDRPALIAWAPDDLFFPMRHARKLAELLPDSRLEEIPESRTFVPEDQPERLAALIRDFVAEGSGSPAAGR